MTNSKKHYIFLAVLALITILITGLNSKRPAEANIMQTDKKSNNAFSVLTANVGNLSLGCIDVLNNLCYKDVEERITKNIQLLNPDIVTLQEVLAPWQCENTRTTNKNKVCYEKQLVPQVRRLLGNNYTIACTDREQSQFECIAIKTSLGTISGCQPGQLCNAARTSIEVDGCDNGFTVSAATVKLTDGFTFDIVNFHPQSTDSECRAKMISQAFEGNNINKPLIQQENVLLMGDFNFDPWREKDISANAWHDFFEKGWGGKQFVYHSGIVEKDPPFFTSFLFFKKRTVDFIVSNFAQGVCRVLGESPNTSRLDGGKGTDHRALFGLLTIKP